MEPSKKDLDRLLDKYISGEANAEERELLERSYMNASMRMPMAGDQELDHRHLDKLGRESLESLITRISPKKYRLWPKIAVAASVALAVITGAHFYYQSKHAGHSSMSTNQISIIPGTNSATLTLSDGKKIRLGEAADGQLANEAGVSISKAADGQLIYEIKESINNTDLTNTLVTAKGETYRVRLPDGTEVWLNAASTLIYPASFASGKQRRVELRGEAYFEVAKDKVHPFVVATATQNVEVLGTHFNINSYADEEVVKTTLLEGSVKVGSARTAKYYILKPGQQAINEADNFVVKPADIRNAVAWKNGEFRFSNENLESIMRKIARWYNVDVEYRGKVTKEGFYGGITRSSNINDVLDILERTKTVHFKIEGRRLIVQ